MNYSTFDLDDLHSFCTLKRSLQDPSGRLNNGDI